MTDVFSLIYSGGISFESVREGFLRQDSIDSASGAI